MKRAGSKKLRGRGARWATPNNWGRMAGGGGYRQKIDHLNAIDLHATEERGLCPFRPDRTRAAP